MTYETTGDRERLILAGVDSGRFPMDIDGCLDELALLVETSGGEAVGRIVQKMDAPHPGHYLGKGKLDELKDLIALTDATGVVCDDELSGNQIKNMEAALETKIMDRTMVILDIFAECARSAEGKAQVELALLNYRVSRLTGLGKSLSRQGGGASGPGGGIGTRGPGETKLETDRRHIRGRIDELNAELKNIEKQREVQRSRREKNNAAVVSMVGYTNAGKSSIMNLLTGAGVFESSRLFATLDTTMRKLELPNGTEILFTDTVGFIGKLPHQLVKAFRATLEELTYADALVHVVDAASANRAEQMKVVTDTLNELGCGGKPVITVFNKTDLLDTTAGLTDMGLNNVVCMSAKTGDGKGDLLAAVEDTLQRAKRRIKILIPYDRGHMLKLIYGNAEILSEEHNGQGTLIEAYADAELAGRLGPYIIFNK